MLSLRPCRPTPRTSHSRTGVYAIRRTRRRRPRRGARGGLRAPPRVRPRRRLSSSRPRRRRRSRPAQPTGRQPPQTSSRRRASAPASTSSASTSSSPTSKGNPVLDLKQDDFEVTRGRQAAEDRLVRASSRSIRCPAGRDAAAAARSASTSTRSARPQRPDVRLFVILLDDYHVRRGNDMAVAQAAHRLRPEPARAAGHGRAHVSADAGHRLHVHPQPRRASSARSSSSRGASSTTSRATSSRSSYAYYPAQTVEQIRNQVDDGRAQGRGGHGWAACARGASRSSSSARGSPDRCRRS